MMTLPQAALVAIASFSALALAAPAAGGQDSPCKAVQVASVDDAAGRSGERFSAAATTDLTFQVFLDPALAGDHVLELRIITPRSFLYRSIAVPVSLGTVPAGAAMTERTVAGYPGPQRVRVPAYVKLAKKVMQRIDIAFPLGGTDIVTNSLYGKWKVEAFLDGGEQRCGPAATFRIVQ